MKRSTFGFLAFGTDDSNERDRHDSTGSDRSAVHPAVIGWGREHR
jgi:hypothetical protein